MVEKTVIWYGEESERACTVADDDMLSTTTTSSPLLTRATALTLSKAAVD